MPTCPRRIIAAGLGAGAAVILAGSMPADAQAHTARFGQSQTVQGITVTVSSEAIREPQWAAHPHQRAVRLTVTATSSKHAQTWKTFPVRQALAGQHGSKASLDDGEGFSTSVVKPGQRATAWLTAGGHHVQQQLTYTLWVNGHRLVWSGSAR